MSFHDAWGCTDAFVMEADDASACLQAPSSDCWSINGAVLDLRHKLENTALGANMLMRIITASAELSRSAREQKRCTDGRDAPAVAHAVFALNTSHNRTCAHRRRHFTLPEMAQRYYRSISHSNQKHTAGGAAQGNFCGSGKLECNY